MLNSKYVFGPDAEIPNSFIKSLKKDYDWDYQIQKGKIKCATTRLYGYKMDLALLSE